MIQRAMKKSRYFAILALAIFLLALAAPAQSATSPATAPVPHGNVTLVAEKPVIDLHADLWLALHFTLEPGWHTYWSNPGDSGEAPRLAWQLPAGLSAGAISWPAPKRLPPGPGIMDFGYSDDAVLLVPLHNSGGLAAGTAANLSVEIKLVVCREICVPGSAQVSLSLPIGAPLAGATARPSPQTASLFAAARSHLPKSTPPQWDAYVRETKDGFLLNIETGHSVSHAIFFPSDEDVIANAAAQPVEATDKGFRMRLTKSAQLTQSIKRLHGVLVLDQAAYTLSAPVSDF